MPQIPFTHPPLGQPVSASRRNVRQQRLADERKPAPAPVAPAAIASRVSGVVYCHAFAEGRPCARSAAGQRCPYPHMSLEQVNAVAERGADGGSERGADGGSERGADGGSAQLAAEMHAFLRAAKKRRHT